MDCMRKTTEVLFLCYTHQCQLGVLPLGTGNDLARVLGWGPSCDDDTQLPQILEKLERASTKMLDRYKHITSIETASLEHFPNIHFYLSLYSWQIKNRLMPHLIVVK